MALTIGTQLGSHEITGLLGKGGMGEVYRGRDLKLKREVAIKILPDEFSRDPARVNRFQREAEVLASLNHPNIGAIYDLEETGETRFLVLELVEGETLAERTQRGPIPVEEALDIARHIADALEAAHEKGVVHRDLKPANVKITPDGRVKVLDFGLAKAVDDIPVAGTASNSPTLLSLASTQAGVILGTAAYMSPEQARGRAVDKRSDIWAFGVVLYEMLTGEQLFQGDTVSDTLAAVLRHEIDWKRVPAKAARLLRQCLERDPMLRLRDIGDMRLLLDDTPRDAAVSHVRWSWRLGLTGWVVAAGLVIVLGFAWWTLRSAQPGDQSLMRLKVDLGPDFSATGVFSAILSPDETRLVYRVRTSEGKYFLAVRPLNQDKEILLPQTENPNGAPFFSPDGLWIGFFSGGKLKKTSVQGGSAVEICDCGAAPGTGSWGEDGNIVLPLATTGGLSRVSAGGGKPEPLTVLAGPEVTHRYPQVLPGAKAVLYTATSSVGNFDSATIQVASMKTGQPKTLVTGGYFGRYVPSNGRRGHILYINQGTLFAIPFDPERLEILGTAQAVVNGIFSSSINGSGRFDLSTRPSPSGKLVYREGETVDESKWAILWVDASGKTTPLVATPGNFRGLRLSPDGRRLAIIETTEKGTDLFVYDTTLDKKFQLTFNGEALANPVWAPDGKHLAFRSKDAMSWIRADGGGEVQLLLQGGNTPSSFSPDGKRLAYYPFGAGTGSDIWILPFDLSDPDHPKLQKPEVFLNSPAGESLPAFSPDGRWIAYRVATGSSGQSVWVRPFPVRPGRWQISADANYPMWSPTAQQLFFERNDGEIMVVDYAVNGDSFVAQNPRPWSPRRAFQPDNTINIDLAPDGKRFVIFDRPVGAGAQPPTHLTFLLNFFDELRRRAPEGK